MSSRFSRILTGTLGRTVVLLLFAMMMAAFTACETPEGGSSLPWSRPEPWEHQMPGVGIGSGYGR